MGLVNSNTLGAVLLGHTPEATIIQSTKRRSQHFALGCLKDCSALTIPSKLFEYEYPDTKAHQDDGH
jgi:hypothetical protein